MKLKRRTLLIVIAVALMALIVGARLISIVAKKKNTESSDLQTPIIRVEEVARVALAESIKVSGTIRPKNEVELFPKISGRITSINFDVGDEVKTKDVLAVIEHREISLQDQAAKASLAVAKSSEAKALIDLKRSQELFADKALAKAQLESAELKYDMAKAQTKNAQAEADIARQQLQNSSITSLIDGTITKRIATVGMSVSPAVSVFTVQDISKLKFVTSVDAATLARLKKGNSATLSLDELQLKVSGKVVTLAPSLDANSRRASIEIELDETKGLVPNMFIDGSLIMNKLENVLAVPNKAIIFLQDQPTVFRIVNGKVEEVHPKLGVKDALNTVVISGLNEGDKVAVSGLERLHDGNAVTIEEAGK